MRDAYTLPVTRDTAAETPASDALHLIVALVTSSGSAVKTALTCDVSGPYVSLEVIISVQDAAETKTEAARTANAKTESFAINYPPDYDKRKAIYKAWELL